MTSAHVPTNLDWIKDAILPVVGFVAGFLVSRFTMTKADRKDVEQKNYENTAALIERFDSAYGDYTAALKSYNVAPNVTLDNFAEVATKGDRYFTQLNFLSIAILSEKVDPIARDQLLLPKLRSAVNRNLPQHYDTLRSIAERYGFAYQGEMRRTDYGALFEVIDRFGPGPEWGDDLKA